MLHVDLAAVRRCFQNIKAARVRTTTNAKDDPDTAKSLAASTG